MLLAVTAAFGSLRTSATSTLLVLDSASKVWVQEPYSDLPLTFEANEGQTDDEVEFLSRGSGYTLFLTPAEAVLVLSNSSAGNEDRDTSAHPTPLAVEDTQHFVFRMQLLE